jgi:hypothetical protein
MSSAAALLRSAALIMTKSVVFVRPCLLIGFLLPAKEVGAERGDNGPKCKRMIVFEQVSPSGSKWSVAGDISFLGFLRTVGMGCAF